MNHTSSRGRHPGRSLAIGLVATLLWKSAYQAADAGYLNTFSVSLFLSVLVAGAIIAAAGYWMAGKARVYLEQAQLAGTPAYASKA